MKKINLQYDGKSFYPYTEDDRDEVAGFKKNQIVSAQIAGVRDVASVRQLNLYWSACAMCAENMDDPGYNTKEKVDIQLRIVLHFVKPELTVATKDGMVHFSYKSISFKNLQQIKRTNYINNAFEQIGKWLGISADEVVKEAMARCKRY